MSASHRNFKPEINQEKLQAALAYAKKKIQEKTNPAICPYVGLSVPEAIRALSVDEMFLEMYVSLSNLARHRGPVHQIYRKEQRTLSLNMLRSIVGYAAVYDISVPWLLRDTYRTAFFEEDPRGSRGVTFEHLELERESAYQYMRITIRLGEQLGKLSEIHNAYSTGGVTHEHRRHDVEVIVSAMHALILQFLVTVSGFSWVDIEEFLEREW